DTPFKDSTKQEHWNSKHQLTPSSFSFFCDLHHQTPHHRPHHHHLHHRRHHQASAPNGHSHLPPPSGFPSPLLPEFCLNHSGLPLCHLHPISLSRLKCPLRIALHMLHPSQL